MITMHFDAIPNWDTRTGKFSAHWGNGVGRKPSFMFRVTLREHTMYVFAETARDAISQATAHPSPIKLSDVSDTTAVVVPFRIRGYSELLFGCDVPNGKWRDATLADLESKVDVNARCSDLALDPCKTDATGACVTGLLGGYKAGLGWYRRDYVNAWKHCQVWEPAT